MSNVIVQPYLFFSGRCDEALKFYQEALGATVEMVLRFSESPVPVPDGKLQAGFENKVMHSSFRIGDAVILASDGCDETSRFDGFRLTLMAPAEAEAHRLFNGLADGGTVDMPLCQTFWSPCYGMVTDRFRVGWMVMVPGPDAAPGK
ncbi:MAG: VOC family protein [Planctomycetaceae bacterium]